ncbi:hypothetical protein WKK05_00825 [Nostoc sp. UHCC 0302]|uniref:hypothetical protein n=1 Tax=Nostoc sp. UHCC 0302 TaxID=3134896 RepID=UPI00311C9EBB
MTDLSSTNPFLIAGIVFTVIAVIGNSKLAFIEINPGLFGRFLALFIGAFSLLYAFGLFNTVSAENIDSFKTNIANQIQQNLDLINNILQRS